MNNKNIFNNSIKEVVNKPDNKEFIEIPLLNSKISRLEELNSEIAKLELEKTTISSEVVDTCKNKLIQLYSKNKSFPGTLLIKTGNMNFQFVTYDKYKNIDEEKYEELLEKYGKESVSEETVFSFNSAILMKHKDHISKLLMGSKKLSKQDKEDLIVNQTTYLIKKGIIKDLFSLKTSLFSKTLSWVKGIIDDIEPVFQIKSIKKD